MTKGDQEARNRIIKAAIEILDEVSDVERVTVRQVAERANVGIGLINYHFQTKDNLLKIAIEGSLANMATNLTAPGNESPVEPVAKLKAMLQELYDYAQRHEKLIQFTLKQGILGGDLQASLFLIPVLREIFGNEKTETDLRIIALQILLPIQITSMNTSGFHLFSGIDLHSLEQRNSYINKLVDNLIKL